MFSDNSSETACNLFEGAPKPFDVQALQDFQAVSTALAASAPRVLWINANFDGKGELKYTEFELDCPSCYLSLVYKPGYRRLPANVPGKMWFTPINGNWYRTDEN